MSEDLLVRIGRGDREAVDECMRQHGNLVWSLARRMSGNRDEAEDAVQEIFIDLWSSASRFDPAIASETTFIAMVARRRLIDRLRRSKRRPATEDLESAEEPSVPPPQADLGRQLEAKRAAEMLETLRPEQRQVLRLSIYKGYSHSDIADKLGMPLGTVKTHARRGLLRIRERLMTRRTPPGEAGS